MYFRKEIELNSHDEKGHCKLGLLLEKEGRFDEAELYMRKSIGINPSYEDGYNSLIQLLQSQNKFSQAELV